MARRYRKAGLVLLLTLGSVLAYAGYAVQAHASGGTTSGYGGSSSSTPSTDRSGMGAELTVNRAAFTGYYDSHTVTYLNTDVSNKAQAAAFHINYSAALATVKGAPAIYFVQGRAAAHQVAVFGSEPGEKDYSPLWAETIVTWKAGVKPKLLTSDNQIAALAQKGKLTIHTNGTVLNCPIIAIGK